MSKAELAREARVGRHTLAAIEKGEGFQRKTLAKIERALVRLEQEIGVNVAPLRSDDDDLVTMEVELPDGRTARVISKGTASPERLAAQVAALLEQMSRGQE